MIIEKGVFEIIYGPMKSGKTKALLDRIEKVRFMKHVRCLVIQPKSNNRDKEVKSRFSDFSFPTTIVLQAKEIMDVYKGEEIVAIDEIQFFDKDIIGVVEALQQKGANVIGAGLNLSFRGEPFGEMGHLISIANKVNILTAVCEIPGCEQPATRTQRLINGKPAHYNEPLVAIEGDKKNEKYEARCLKHHLVPKEDNERQNS